MKANKKIANNLKATAHELIVSLDWRQKFKYLQEEGKKYTFTFRNEAMQDLWREELLGQMSDGMWENDPNSHWEFWAEVNTNVGGFTRLSAQIPYGIKTGFAFTSLIQYVGDRMLDIVQRYEPNATEKTLRAYLQEINEAMRKGEADARGGTVALEKDIMRIEDIVNKYPNDNAKQLAAAQNMANKITDAEKARRRADAAEQMNYHDMAEIFYNRALALAK